ncbi:MAG: DNA polymerase III subunit delta [Oscillospiraceae bacterium]|nr:DNA polymerase III subunit delta [Oscillospiraceae bacterium]
MAVIDEKECKRQLKEAVLSRLYVICGDEDYLKQVYAGKLSDQATAGPFRDFNFHRFEGKDTSLDEIAQAAEAFPVGAERSCVLVRDFPLDGDPSLLRFLRELPQHCVMLFWMDTLEFSPKKNKQLAAAVGEAGHFLQLDRPGAVQLAQLICSSAKKRGGQMDKATADYLIETVGGDLNTLLRETEKLCAYAGDASITKAHVDTVAVKSIDAKAFDMVKAVSAGNGTLALRLLDDLFAQKTAPELLLGSLITQFMDIFRAAVARRAGKRPEAAADLFAYRGMTFRLTNAARTAAKLQFSQICGCLDHLDTADRQLKSSPLDKRFVLERCVIALMHEMKAA